MPRSHGDGQVHYSKFTAAVCSGDAIYEVQIAKTTAKELAMGKHITYLVEDGAMLQLGIGDIPGAVKYCLADHKNPGIHTEMFTDAILPLVESGIINGTKKKKHSDKIVSDFALVTRKLYDFIHDNLMVFMLDVAYVNDAPP